MDIVFYTIDCPNCKELEARLDAAKIDYVTVTDMSVMEEKGISTAPMLEVDGNLMSFGKAVKWLKQARQ